MLQLFTFFKHFHNPVLIPIYLSFWLVLFNSKLTSTFKGFLFIYLKRPLYSFMILRLFLFIIIFFSLCESPSSEKFSEENCLAWFQCIGTLWGKKPDKCFLKFLGHIRSINLISASLIFPRLFFPSFTSLLISILLFIIFLYMSNWNFIKLKASLC